MIDLGHGIWGLGFDRRRQDEMARPRKAVLRSRLLLVPAFALGFSLAWLLR